MQEAIPKVLCMICTVLLEQRDTDAAGFGYIDDDMLGSGDRLKRTRHAKWINGFRNDLRTDRHLMGISSCIIVTTLAGQ